MRAKWLFLYVLLSKRKGIIASDVVPAAYQTSSERCMSTEIVASSMRKKKRSAVPECFPDLAVKAGENKTLLRGTSDEETSLRGTLRGSVNGSCSNLLNETNDGGFKDVLKLEAQVANHQFDSKQKRVAYQKVEMDPKGCPSKNVEQDLENSNLRRKTTCEASKAMTMKLDFLHSRGMEVSDVEKLRKKRHLMVADVDHVHSVFVLLQKFFGDETTAGKVLVHNPKILSDKCSLLEERWKFLTDTGIRGKAFRTGKDEGGLLAVPLDRMQENISFFHSIGFTTAAVNAMVHRFPRILRFSVKSCLQPKICLFKSMGMTDETIMKVIWLNPCIFGASIDNNLVKKFKLFQEFGLSIEECCQTLGKYNASSYKSILMQVEVLKSFGLIVEDVARLFRLRPDLFSRSPETLRAKLNLLINVEKRNIIEIIRYPHVLCYDMERRIVPRLNMLREVGKLDSVSLSVVATLTDAKFKRRVTRNK